MSAVDAAWYHMDGLSNLAMVTGVILTREALSYDKVHAIFRERMPAFERFRQRVVECGFPIATPHWEDVPNFDINQHIHHVALPAPHDDAALRTLIADIASTPLNHALPLWQVHVIDGVGNGSAVVIRYHHCIADGTGMMVVTQRLFDAAPGVLHSLASPLGINPSSPPVDEGVLSTALNAVERAASDAFASAGAAAMAIGGAGILLGELLRRPDAKSPLKSDFSAGKRVAWSAQVAIKDVRAIGARTNAKVNDVLVAATTGALRAYLQQRGMDVSHTPIRAMVPVDLRAPEVPRQLGNDFGLLILDLAVASAHPDQRLALTKVRMEALKRSPQPVAIRLLLDIFGRVPKAVGDVVNDLFGSKASMVLTDMAGPRETLYLAGVPIDRMLFWVPHPGKQLGISISIYSYRGTASLAIMSDAHLVPDPETITTLFNQEFAAMLEATKTRGSKAPVRKPVGSDPASRHKPPANNRQARSAGG